MLRDDPQAFWSQKRIVASIATARRREHAERLFDAQFDLVIVDEAHHLRDRSSQSWKLVDALNKRFLLLLSATPVQNDLIELYNLLTLLKPGIFKTPKEFRTAYMTPGNPRRPANPERLRALHARRHDPQHARGRRPQAAAPPRHDHQGRRAAPAEAEAYADLAARRRAALAAGDGGRRASGWRCIICWPPPARRPAAAASGRADRRAQTPPIRVGRALAERWAAIEIGGKEAALLELVRRNPAEKKLVFVHSRETLAHLADRLDTRPASPSRASTAA